MRRATVVAVLVVLAGCKEDLKPQLESWDKAMGEWKGRTEKLQQEVAKVGGDEANTLDPQNAAAKMAEKLAEDTKAVKQQVSATGDLLSQNDQKVKEAAKEGKAAKLDPVIASARTEIDANFNRVESAVKQLATDADSIKQQVQQEKDAAEAAAKAAADEEKRWSNAATGAAPLELTGIAFKPGTMTLDTDELRTAKTLEKLTAFANECPELTFSITGHVAKDVPAKDAMKQSEARAKAVKQYLVDQRVPAKRIAKVSGVGNKEPAVDEPDPTAEATQAMNPEDLEAIREKNRGFTVKAVKACAAKPDAMSAPAGEAAATPAPEGAPVGTP